MFALEILQNMIVQKLKIMSVKNRKGYLDCEFFSFW